VQAFEVRRRHDLVADDAGLIDAALFLVIIARVYLRALQGGRGPAADRLSAPRVSYGANITSQFRQADEQMARAVKQTQAALLLGRLGRQGIACWLW